MTFSWSTVVVVAIVVWWIATRRADAANERPNIPPGAPARMTDAYAANEFTAHAVDEARNAAAGAGVTDENQLQEIARMAASAAWNPG